MSADGSITTRWGDEEFTFRLAIGELRKLDAIVNADRIKRGQSPIGPMTLYHSLRTLDAWPDDVRQVLRLGLIGGGMNDDDLRVILIKHFDQKAPFKSYPVALEVLSAALFGVEDDQPGKQDAAPKEATESGLSFQASTGQERPSDGMPGSSIN